MMATTRPIPHLPGMPLLGNLLAFRYRRLAFLRHLTEQCGDVSELYLGRWPVLFLNAAPLVEAVLVQHAASVEKSPLLRRHLRPILGDGLLTIENAPHAHHRRFVAPAFQPRRVATYAPVMTAYAEQVQAEWVNGQEVDLADAMLRLTLGIVGKTLFDADVLTEAVTIGTALTQIQHYANAVANALVDVPLSWPLPRNRHTRRALAYLTTTINAIIATRRASGEDRGDFLSSLLHAQQADQLGLTDAQVRDHALTLVLAGHETTAVALTWTWYLLMRHPAVYQRVQDEVDQVLAGRTPNVADLAHLPYTLHCINEALRLYPPVYVLARSATQPLEIGGYQIPAGRSILISPYTLHRHPDYFPQPDHFNPDRWTSPAATHLPRGAYLPFGAGPRVCIGQPFALMELHLIVATLAQQLTFDLVPGQAILPEPLLTLRPNSPVRVIVRRRTIRNPRDSTRAAPMDQRATPTA